MSDIPDYSDVEDAPSEDRLTRLRNAVIAFAKTRIEYDELEEKLRAKKKEVEQYEQKILPEMMREIDVPILGLPGGAVAELKDEIHASFPKDPDKQEACFVKLQQMGEDGMIKTVVSAQFGRDSTDEVTALLDAIETLPVVSPPMVSADKWIEPATLTSFLKRMKKEGRLTAEEIKMFGGFERTVVKIKLPK